VVDSATNAPPPVIVAAPPPVIVPPSAKPESVAVTIHRAGKTETVKLVRRDTVPN
jgi:hypothetical protein